MSQPKLEYFTDGDIIHIDIKDGKEARSVELAPNITVELDDQDEIIGIEILGASQVLRDSLLETVQGKMLQNASR